MRGSIVIRHKGEKRLTVGETILSTDVGVGEWGAGGGSAAKYRSRHLDSDLNLDELLMPATSRLRIEPDTIFLILSRRLFFKNCHKLH